MRHNLKNISDRIATTFDFTQRQRKVLIYGCLLNFLTFMVGSLLAPFYTMEAEKRNISVLYVGMVFGASGFCYAVFHTVFGKLFPLLNVKLSIGLGNFFSGMFDLLLGLLVFSPTPSFFIVSSIILQALSAIATSAVQTLVYSMFCTEFGEKLNIAQSMSNIALMCAFILGPVIGGVIYRFFGFAILYVLMGILQIVWSPTVKWMLPVEIKKYNSKNENPVKNKVETLERILHPSTANSKKDATFWSVITIPNVIFNIAALYFALFSFFAIVIDLQRYMHDVFHMNEIQIGLVFGIPPLVALIFCVPVGAFTDSYGFKREIIIAGHFAVSIMNFFAIPPNYQRFWFYYPGSFFLFMCSIVLLGFSMIILFIPTLKEIIESCFMSGIKQNAGTNGIASGIWASSMAAAKVLGPLFGGFLMQVLHFKIGAVLFICACLQFTVALLWSLYTIFIEPPNHRYETYAKILHKEDQSARPTQVEVST